MQLDRRAFTYIREVPPSGHTPVRPDSVVHTEVVACMWEPYREVCPLCRSITSFGSGSHNSLAPLTRGVATW